MEIVSSNQTVLAFDVGEKRIGVARAHLSAPFPFPLTTLVKPESFIDDIAQLCAVEGAACVVLGLPRGMQGQSTDQTRTVEAFGKQLEVRLSIPLYWIDEALTSQKAEIELRSRGKPYSKGDIDALAATYILEDFFKTYPKGIPGV